MSAGITVLRLHDDDNVGVAMRDLTAGEMLAEHDLKVRQGIGRGHRIALAAIGKTAVVRKFGQPIGLAATDIAQVEHVHTHNLAADHPAMVAGETPGNPPWAQSDEVAHFHIVSSTDGRLPR